MSSGQRSARAMHDTGLAWYGAADAVRWVAIRHGRNHAAPRGGESNAEFTSRTGQEPADGAGPRSCGGGAELRPDGSRARAGNDRWHVQGCVGGLRNSTT